MGKKGANMDDNLITEDEVHEVLYRAGIAKPHYPVPAIPWVDTSSLNYWVNGVCSD